MTDNINEYQEHSLMEMPVIILEKHGKPCIELRRAITDQELIKAVVSAAWHEKPIIIIPRFKDKIRSLANLIDKGIIYKDQETEQYLFINEPNK
jgi:hypothetical protein